MPTEVNAATNKALRIKVDFNGKRDDSAFSKNNHILTAGYLKNGKLKKNMKISAQVYVPVKVLKKDGDAVHLNIWLDLCTAKKGTFVGTVQTNYTIMLMKSGKKIVLKRWNEAKQKEESIGSIASYKKSGNYYIVSIKNCTYLNKMQKADGSEVALNTKTSYQLIQNIGIVGTCSKSSGYVYLDNIKLTGVTTQNVTFNKKDYQFVDGAYRNKSRAVKITTIQ